MSNLFHHLIQLSQQKRNQLVALVVFVVTNAGMLTACSSTSETHLLNQAILVSPATPAALTYQNLSPNQRVKKVYLDLDNPNQYATISLLSNGELLIDNLNIPSPGNHKLSALVNMPADTSIQFTLKSNNAPLNIRQLTIVDTDGVLFPKFQDRSTAIGLDKVNSIKYGGPTVADLDNDGDYDFILNNHNAETSKLYWNNGDGTVSKHDKNLARWFMHDLHGTAAGDFDNDGDLDLVVTQGGGNGKNPSKANFYTNNNGKLVLTTGDVNIDRGGRGRGARWLDADLDGDLDLMLVNEASLTKQKPQHYFYENRGDGKFNFRNVEQLQDMEASRVLISDINNDHIDDIIIYSPLSIWQGNGDFTYTNVTEQLPSSVQNVHDIMALTHLDIDNDGDLDLYLARGKVFEHGKGEAPSLDLDVEQQELSIKPRGYQGLDAFSFTGRNNLTLHKYDFLTQGAFRGKQYPIFLGANKTKIIVGKGEKLDVSHRTAQGWPTSLAENGAYFGYLGKIDGQHKWRTALVRNGDLFWTYRFSLLGVNSVKPDFTPENRNISDILLQNDNGTFVDVSNQWQLPVGGNALGVTNGDFNNDGHQDLLVNRWGYISHKISDLMLLNTGKGHFETITMHGANDVGGPGNGDMGQAFDFNLDGKLDILSGSENGQWYLYQNQLETNNDNHYALVRVGYSPKHNVDAISAKVTVETNRQTYHQAVASAGAIFSQSLLNIVHFGLGQEDKIKRVTVTWRNGETVTFEDKKANQLFDTNLLDPNHITFEPAVTNLRVGATKQLTPTVLPKGAKQKFNWHSSDDDLVTVSSSGVITSQLPQGTQLDATPIITITATSPDNGLSAAIDVQLVEWFSQSVSSVKLTPTDPNAELQQSNNLEMIAGDTLELSAVFAPLDADNAVFKWHSNDNQVVQLKPSPLNQHSRIIEALGVGTATVTVHSLDDKQISDKITISVKPLIEPHIEILNADEFTNKPLTIGDNITVNARYHAGTGNTVIHSDEGGVRFWLRHFKSKWIPVKDIVKVASSALYTESGQVQMTFSLADLTPTNKLPEGHFYQLRVSFTTSNGEMRDAVIYPLKLIE